MIEETNRRKVNLRLIGLRAQPFFILLNHRLTAFCFCLLLAATLAPAANGAELSNDTLRLTLGVTSDGIPLIEKGEWVETGSPVFADLGTPDGWKAWLPEALIPGEGVKIKYVGWRVTEDEHFFIAKTFRDLTCGIRISWVVELAKQGSLFRLHIRLRNSTQQSQAIDWFPTWVAAWDAGDKARWVRWWDSLSFSPSQQSMSSGEEIELSSHLHSSDSPRNGANPYWVVGGKQSRLHFGIEWCGGWEAKLRGTENGVAFSVRLPPDETQLTLKPGEIIEGPALIVTPTGEADDMNSRYAWMMQRQALAQNLYGGPLPSFPLTYNHWYSVRFNVSSKFLRKQLASMSPYGFDAFIVDAGWYDRIGSWQPDGTKFLPGEFEEILASIKDQGVRPGIWSCPQFVGVDDTLDESEVPPGIEQPLFFNSFVDAYLLDLVNTDFKGLLTSHVSLLRGQYLADWWKYDQEFFVSESNAGVMKNVLAFQDALRAVRVANPDLTIENCQSGGRMINEFTLLATQISWLRDGSDNGMEHARANISLALGAMEFIFPWAIYRWTNELDDMDQNDDELTRFYCRSAMAGTWGISSDLSEIGDRQRNVILREIRNYRRLNEIKQNCIYELLQPASGNGVAGVTFYDAQHQRAAVLLYRWDRNGAFEENVTLNVVKSKAQFRITDADTGIKTKERGKNLVKNGLTVSFGPNRLSALLFIEPVS
ncbi:MAG TPA: alpha-galactosidase [Blastocatellia bacterium]|nr:alpha-galactosidase [Blastocatellia bacterium]